MLGNPLDEVIGILAEGDATGVVVADVFTLRVTGTAQIPDDVNVVLGDDACDIAGLDAPIPQWGGSTLWRGGQGECLEFLAVGGQCDQCGTGLVDVRLVSIGGECDTVTHGDRKVLADADGLPAGVEVPDFAHVVLLCFHSHKG